MLLPLKKTIKKTDRKHLLSFFYTCVLLYRLSGDGCGRFRGVVLLNVSSGSGDGSPCLATSGCDADSTNRHDDKDLSHVSFKLRFVKSQIS